MALSSLLQWFPHAMQPHVMDLVTPVWNIFLTSTPLYPQPPPVCVHVAMETGCGQEQCSSASPGMCGVW